MKLRALRLWNVRKFAGRGIAIENIGDGVNVLSAENEFGKSTSFDALHAAFFQPFSGTPKPVQMLRPYSGGSPQVEVDVETHEGQFRISKTYYTGKNAVITDIATNRIVAQADAAETWIANLIRGGSAGPAGLLWVQQGATDIGGGSNKEKDEERRVREDVLTSVTGDEVEFLTGGRRMLRVLDRTNAKLEELVTSKGKPKAGGQYAKAFSELEDLQGKETDLASQISDLRSALDTRRKKLKRLKDLNDPDAVQSRLQQKTDAAERLEAAKEQSGKLATAEAQEKLAVEKCQNAKNQLETHQSKLEKLGKIVQQIIEGEAQQEDAKLKRNAALSANESSQKALQTCDERLNNARELLNAAKRSMEAERAAEQFTELKTQLEKAEKLRGEIEKLEAECDALLVDDQVVGQLETFERRIETLNATILTESVVVQVDYVEPSRNQITHDGSVLADGQSIKVSSETCLDIPQVGQLTISVGSDASTQELEAELQEVKEQLRSGLSQINCVSILAAKEQLTIAKAKTSSLMLKRAELETRAPEGIDTLRQRSVKLEELCKASDPQKTSLDDAERELAAAIETHRTTQSDREIARSAYHDAKDEVLRRDIMVAGIRKERQELETEFGSDVEQSDHLKSLQSAFADEQEILAAAQKVTGELRADAPDLKSVTATYERAASTHDRAQAEIDILNKEVAELDGRISVSSGHGIEDVYEEVKGRCIASNSRVGRFNHEVAALSRLKEALEDARSSAKDQYFEPVMAELKPLLTLLLDEASITFDEATLLPRTLGREGLDEDITFLSGGMREQLAILTRLAFARLLAKSGNPVPVILDDALVYSDDERIERMFDALHRQANDLQILVFSCRQRAFERLGGNGLNMTEWKPGDS
ncbi:DNA-binding protein [Sulfitobacter sp. SK012]|uniref:AAA family ATPase n=1 Tax=Sulfitobacter sp. SK012 TaxID=1389005 RepID=UPI000E0A8D4D|nr:AAA family ATPase [Sulfitobacter sp. SK012]AXI45848.1 DNA-binding protein [Sulfitobacter sp. SK012]